MITARRRKPARVRSGISTRAIDQAGGLAQCLDAAVAGRSLGRYLRRWRARLPGPRRPAYEATGLRTCQSATGPAAAI